MHYLEAVHILMILLSEKECEESQPTDPDRGSLTTYRLLGKQGLGGGGSLKCKISFCFVFGFVLYFHGKIAKKLP